MLKSDWREYLKRYLRTQRKGQLAIVDEYIQEAEHQDGRKYWDQFEDGADVVADFDIYVANREETPAADEKIDWLSGSDDVENASRLLFG